MKVLYIAHYKEGTGWSQAAIDYILAMDSVGIDVACRNVSLTGANAEVPQRILELEKKDVSDADMCIQHLLPHHLVGSEKFKKNIALFVSETSSIKMNPWFVHLEQMDEIWVPSEHLWDSMSKDNINAVVKVVPHAFDMSKYNKKYTDMNNPTTDDTFKFYYIGDINQRKNIETILRCFHSEFDISEPVSLILKVNKFGHSPEQVHQVMNGISEQIKSDLRMYDDIRMYRPEAVLASRIPEEDLYALHQYCDCFVCPSHGEAWSIPSFDAMAFGNTPICSDFGGPRDFIEEGNLDTGWVVSGVDSVCTYKDAAFREIFTGRETWVTPNESEIKKAMRHYYENKNDSSDGLERANEFSYENVGNLIKEFLGGK